MSPELPPRLGLGLLKRAAVASIAIVLLAAGAVSAAVMLQFEDVANIIRDGRPAITIPELDRAEAGDARTIMILGSDARWGDEEAGIPPRADTIILVRMDPDEDAITMMSVPRDLKIKNPSWSRFPDKINAAYANGGARTVVQTVRDLLSTDGQPFEVNHVVQVDFAGFRRGVDYLGCVYVDIDRRYFNDRGGPGGYATIDVQPGYQRMCGRDALDYVRYRHTDNDLVRAARQQDFLRQLKGQDGVRSRLNFDARREIARIISRYTDTDRSLRETSTLFSLLKLGIFLADKPIQEVRFGRGRLEQDGPYLVAGRRAIEDTVHDFFHARTEATTEGSQEPTEAEREVARKRPRRPASGVPGLEVAPREGEDKAIVAQGRLDFPIYFPTLRATGGQYAGDPRTYRIRDALGERHTAYRMVVKKGLVGEYYGIQGMTWKDPPILDGPHDVEVRNGRRLQVYYDGQRVRLVAWKTKNALYYVHNTLERTLNRRQMLAIAASFRRPGQT
jgi:polyisoprenyl-teichoic acid--peptidoglycan teichoic acid transferase